MMRWLVLGLSLVAGVAQATPKMSLTAGTPCVACHVNPNGGEGRTELGWSAMSHTGALSWQQLGMPHAKDTDTNTWLNGSIAAGIDARTLTARLGRPLLVDQDDGGQETVYPDYISLPMQLQPYLTIRPADDITLYGTFLAGPGTLRDGEFCDPVFAGMSCYGAQVIYEATPTTSARIGMFQPAMGIRHDDHTMLTRGDAANPRVPVIAPGYAELGTELAWQPKQWLRFEVGGFHTGNLDDALNSTTETSTIWPMAYQTRIVYQPHIEIGGDEASDDFDDFDDFDAEPAAPTVLNTWFGVSAYGSGDFVFVNEFIGVGLHNGLSMVLETSQSKRTVEHSTLNGLLGLSYAPWDWFSVNARAERAQTKTTFDKYVTWQYVGGLEFFPVPYIEVRPEYRLTETDGYRFGQATLQMHLFY